MDMNEKSGVRTITVKKDGVNERKLTRFVEKNGFLIAKSFGLEKATVEKGEDGDYLLPWISEDDDEATVQAEILFIAKMMSYIRTANRVSAIAKPIKNERYAFRALMGRIRMGGPGYKDERRLLMRRLTGDAAYSNGRPKKEGK